MHATGHRTTSWPPPEAAIQGPLVLALRRMALDGRVRPGHDGMGEFMAETQKLIGVSLEGSVG